MRKDTLLVEIGTEELPPKSLKSLGEAFLENVCDELKKAELPFSDASWFAAPRRLAVCISELSASQEDKTVEKRGPAVQAAFDDQGNPTKAALGWAKSNGIDVNDAQRLKTDKGEWLLHTAHETGKPLQALVGNIVNNALNKLPIPKPMRWSDCEEQFIRPIHTVCIMYGDELVDATVKGVKSDRVLRGHRFHGDGTVSLGHAKQYLDTMRSQYVVADFNERKETIKQQLNEQAKQFSAQADFDEALLEEIASLVEWPVVMSATFDDSFLAVPKEALIYTMKDDQKYVPLLDDNGILTSRFLFVSNIDSRHPQKVIEGNEKVIRPRLSDAQFFFDTDKKTPLIERVDSLHSVLFQKQLGTLADKSERIKQLAAYVASQLGANTSHAQRAGELCKTDLMTNMVMEFPDVQGVMGMHYARHDGEPEDVAVAMFEQYLPRFSGDVIPSQPVSCALSIADKLDTLVGIFGIGLLPKGDKDPFALRRNAIGLIRVIAENNLSLDLSDLISQAVDIYGDRLTNKDVFEQLLDFILGRFKAYYLEQGISQDVIQAVAVRRPTKPADYAARIAGVLAFKALPQAESLAAANKRVANILAKNSVEETTEVNPELFENDIERQLHSVVVQLEAAVTPLIESGRYTDVLTSLAQSQASVDDFFDNVMVMADDDKIRSNRLALLSKLRTLFLHTADISLLS
ncbi:glycine--tRNA ligase subunit beta [Aestuariibacter salexigens]|uniref:glycine--tRNA ligase subunit beta n=1 Tax=Aestuariibacter salexigens TaxID=226010 RepID=UPI0003F97DB0|nr:glycine--tRNA ligase subunit beta [Aestuariibacter salexigens]